jgi:mono/diheme cytochrome c family protein
MFLGIPLFLAAATTVPLILAGPTTVASTGPSTAPSRTVWDGVYSSEQAARGQKVYNASCARCHADNLMGNDDAPQLIDKEFLSKWNGKPVGSLVELTRKTMPSDGPGKLTRKVCTDITAYLLSANDFPAGQSDLAPDPDVLNGILIQSKK